MLVAAAAAAHKVDPRDVIVAIVGGTLLTLALTRPRLKWMERLTDDSESWRRWTERGLTFLAFVMGGYAWAALFIFLHRQLTPEADAMLKGSAVFFVIYAGLVHFEPFVAAWRLRGGPAAIALYVGVTTFAAIVGVSIALMLLEKRWTPTDPRLLFIGGGVTGLCWLAYRHLPRPESLGIAGKGANE